MAGERKPKPPELIEDRELDQASGGTLSVGSTDSTETGISARGRVPGKININTVTDPD